MPSADLSQLVVLVTGGGSGIGRGIAEAFARQGASVAVSGRRLGPLDETAAALEAIGVRALAIAGDVSQPDQAEHIVAQTRAALGDLHCVVNNAGVAVQGPFVETTVDDVHRLIDIDLKGPIFVIRAAIPHLARHAERRLASILNISSSVTQIPLPSYTLYAAAKAGLDNLTRGLALELAPQRIRVNAISPGVVATPIFARMLGQETAAAMLSSFGPMVPLGRVGQPSDIARMAVTLCAPSSDWITGAIVAVDGGLALGTVAPE
jgi:NAD(P)-dependent dehydrogenase (short-subunit alcohol dehydrogenase family)